MQAIWSSVKQGENRFLVFTGSDSGLARGTDMDRVISRVHKNKSRQLHTMGSVTAEFEVRHRWRTTTLFSGRYALNAEHVHARSLQKLHLFDWHFRLGLHFACTCSSKYSVQRWVQCSRINVFPFLVQTDVGSDDELRILPWQHS